MSITLKGKWLLLAVFIFGCATGPAVQKYLSFKDAIAKTGKKCHYAKSHIEYLGNFKVAKDGKITIFHDWNLSDRFENGNKLMKDGWKPVSIGGSSVSHVLWRKCTRS